MGVVRTLRQGEEKPSVRDHRLGKAAVTCPAVKLSVRAQVLLAAPAKRTEPTRKAQPRRADPHARRERLDSRAYFRHAADDLMAGNHARSAPRQIAIDDMKVGSTNAARADLDDDVGRVLHLRPAPPPTNQRRADGLANHRRIN